MANLNMKAVKFLYLKEIFNGNGFEVLLPIRKVDSHVLKLKIINELNEISIKTIREINVRY